MVVIAMETTPSTGLRNGNKKSRNRTYGCGKSHKEKKRLWHSLRAEGKPVIAMSARLIRNLKQLLVDDSLGIVFGLHVGDAENDCGE
jgi:hypothetical protein